MYFYSLKPTPILDFAAQSIQRIKKIIHVFWVELLGYVYAAWTYICYFFQNLFNKVIDYIDRFQKALFSKAKRFYQWCMTQQEHTSAAVFKKSFTVSSRDNANKEDVFDNQNPTIDIFKKLAEKAKTVPNNPALNPHLVYGCQNTLTIKDDFTFLSDWWYLPNRGQGDCAFLSLSAGFILWTLSMTPEQLKSYYSDVLSKRHPDFANKTVWDCMNRAHTETPDFFESIEVMRQDLHKSKDIARTLQAFADRYQSSLRHFLADILRSKFSNFLKKYQGNDSRNPSDSEIDALIQSIQMYYLTERPKSQDDANLITVLRLDEPQNDLWGKLCFLVKNNPDNTSEIKRAWSEYCKTFDSYVKNLATPYRSVSAAVAVAMFNMYWRTAVRICQKEGSRSKWLPNSFYTQEEENIEYAHSMQLSQIPFALHATPGHLEVMFCHNHLCPCSSCHEPHRPPVNLFWISSQLKDCLTTDCYLENQKKSAPLSVSHQRAGL